MYRQGDVLIVRIHDGFPENMKEVKMSKLGPILALGEVTGHHHTVVAQPEAYDPGRDLPHADVPKLGMSLVDYAQKTLDDLEVKRVDAVTAGEPACRLYEPDGGDESLRFLDVERPTVLRHDEHGAIGLLPGKYKIVRQKEYRPGGWQNVQD
jgi:hypothetical protein